MYGGLVSSTAPDYTANCLAAKDADAEMLMLLIATADTGRKIADDCARAELQARRGSSRERRSAPAT